MFQARQKEVQASCHLFLIQKESSKRISKLNEEISSIQLLKKQASRAKTIIYEWNEEGNTEYRINEIHIKWDADVKQCL